jgi:8-amino-7-oxononanoate synthase
VPDSFQSLITSSLTARREQQAYRSRRVVAGPQDVRINIDGKTLLSFCSNDYLGLANHPDVVKAFHQGANDYGAGSGAAHLINGHSRTHHALEEELAAFVQRPRALLFSTGYMANLGTVASLVGKEDSVIEDRWNHASLIDAGLSSGARLRRYQHSDIDSLQQQLKSCNSGRKLIVTDGVFSMDGDIALLDNIATIARQHDAWVMVDDAHGLGVLGEQGRGSVNHFGLTMDDVPVLMGTLGKAFGTFGAFVAGSDDLIEFLIQQARTYVYTTALPSAVAEATRASLHLVQTEQWRRDKLNALVQRFRSGVQELGLTLTESTTPIQPLIIGDNATTLRLSEQLYHNGILISAIRPPTVPDNTARLRITFSASHEDEDVDVLLSNLEKLA